MDVVTVGAAIALMKKMPDNAAHSAAEAKSYAEAAAESASTVTSATVAETIEYLGIEEE